MCALVNWAAASHGMARALPDDRRIARLQEPQMAQARLRRRNGDLHTQGSGSQGLASRPGYRLLTIWGEGHDSKGDKVIEFESAVVVKAD